jgi:hypothetical protein
MYENQGYAANAQLANIAKATAMAQNGAIGAGQVISKHSEIAEQFNTLEILLEENERLASQLMEKISGILDMSEYPPSPEKEGSIASCRSQLGETLQNLSFRIQSNNRRFKNILNRVQL